MKIFFGRLYEKVLIFVLTLFFELLLFSYSKNVEAYENDTINVYTRNYEVVSLRDKYTKHFKLSDGSYRAIIYGFPIHELDFNGNYVDLYSFDYEGFNNNPDIDPLIISTDDNIVINRDDIGLNDTYISSSNPNTNYGSSFSIAISNNSTQIGFIKLLTSSIPGDATITTGQIRFLYYYIKSNNNYMDIGAYEILSNWNESTVTWNSNTSISSTCQSTFRTLGSATLLNSLYATLDITDSIKAWYSGERNNYGIAIKYDSGYANNLQIRTRENVDYHTTLIVNYTTGLNINNGTYFIRNGHLEKYVQIDDGDSNNNYNTEGAILELWTGTGASFQKWIFEYLHNGYYKIISYQSGKVISVQSGYENTGNHALRQETYNGSFRQQWSITRTASHKFKIKPRSSEAYSTDWVMCCGEGIGGNGRNVEQREYSDNAVFKDEWELYHERSFVFYGISDNDSSHDHQTCLINVESMVNDYCFNDVTKYFGWYTAQHCLNSLENYNVFVSRSHGNKYIESGNLVATSIFVYYDSPNICRLFSHNCSYVSSNDAFISTNDFFNNLEIAVFVGCNTGYHTISSNNNLPSKVVEQGCIVSIGFESAINCGDANEWTEYFFEFLLYGYSVSNAINMANSLFDSSSTIRNTILYGDGTYTIYD